VFEIRPGSAYPVAFASVSLISLNAMPSMLRSML